MLWLIYKAIIRLKDHKEKLPFKMPFSFINLQGNFSLVSLILMMAQYITRNT